MLWIFQVVSGAAWAVYRLMQDTPVWNTSNFDHNHRCVYFFQPCYRAILISYDLKKLVRRVLVICFFSQWMKRKDQNTASSFSRQRKP